MRDKDTKNSLLTIGCINFFVPLQYENRNYSGYGQRVYTAQVYSRTYRTEYRNHKEFVIGEVGNKDIVLQKCGIGKVNSAVGAVE